MKRSIGIICAAAIMLSAAAVWADDGDIEYTSEGGNITVINEYGLRMYRDDYANYEYYPSTDGMSVGLFYKGNRQKDVIVPATINGVPVTEVFARTGRRSGLESITFPDTVQSVEEFYGYTDLKRVFLPNSIKEIPRDAFKDCTSLESIEIPASVEKIDVGAFNGCTSLKKIKFNDGLYSISGSAFRDCPIESLDLPSTLEKIERGSFSGNTALKKLTIPGSVRSIGNSAFSNTGLEGLSFEGVPETIGDYAFRETPLKEVSGLSRENMIMFWNAFYETPWQTEMVDENEPFLVDTNGRLVAYAGSETEIEIPDTVKKIATNAFVNKNITSVKLPDSLTEIEERAFIYCKKLGSITIPASVNKIGQMAFSDCYKLKDITFEYSSATLSLGSSAFQFTLASPETLVTNNRRYTNQKTAFQNTYFDIDYVPVSVNDTEIATKPPEVTEAPKETEKPTAAPEPTEQPGTIEVGAGDKITVEVNSRAVTFPDAEPFIDENGRTQIPIRAVAEALGCEVKWDSETRTATITKDDITISIAIGKNIMQVGREVVTMDTAAEIVDDRTYIPIRFVGEALGMKVNWVSR